MNLMILKKNMHLICFYIRFKDTLSTLKLYKVKIANTLKHYLKTKGPMKWYIGMQVVLHKISSQGVIAQEARAGFTSGPRNTLSMVDFEELYAESSNKIMHGCVN